MSQASDTYITAQVADALYEVLPLREVFPQDKCDNVARLLISALDDRDIELRPR